jgi:hypothetical protein
LGDVGRDLSKEKNVSLVTRVVFLEFSRIPTNTRMTESFRL